MWPNSEWSISLLYILCIFKIVMTKNLIKIFPITIIFTVWLHLLQAIQQIGRKKPVVGHFSQKETGRVVRAAAANVSLHVRFQLEASCVSHSVVTLIGCEGSTDCCDLCSSTIITATRARKNKMVAGTALLRQRSLPFGWGGDLPEGATNTQRIWP